MVYTQQVESANAAIQPNPNLVGLLTIRLEESATPAGPTTVLFKSAKASTSTKPVIVNPPKPPNLSDTVQPEEGGSILGCVANPSQLTVLVNVQLCRDF
jgi:hypothetical protein